MSASDLGFLIARRLLALGVLLIIISFGVFSLLYLAPGSAEQILLGPKPQTPETLRAIREQYHLNDPFLTQYWIWLRDALHFDFGRSIRTNEVVTAEIRARIGIDLFLGIYGFLLAMLVGVPLGVLAALKRRTSVDRGVVGLSVVGVSAPAFASGLFLLYMFAVVFAWFPAFGPGSGFTDRLSHLTLPAIALALTAMALVVKLTRAAMITALDQDYVAFARARGLPAFQVTVFYALRNALVPIVTAGGLILGYMLTGAILVEVTFALPGVGSLLIDAVNFKDVPIVQAIAIIAAATIVFVNLLTDIVYLLIDPRIRYGRTS
jgi:peptide/nickel transport system permease protein